MQLYGGQNPARNHVTDRLVGVSADIVEYDIALWVGMLAVCVVLCAVTALLWLSRDVAVRDVALDADAPSHLPRS